MLRGNSRSFMPGPACWCLITMFWEHEGRTLHTAPHHALCRAHSRCASRRGSAWTRSSWAGTCTTRSLPPQSAPAPAARGTWLVSRVVVRRVAVRVVEAAMGRAATVALRETVRKPTHSPLVLAAMQSLWLPSLGPLSVTAARLGAPRGGGGAAGVTNSRLPGVDVRCNLQGTTVVERHCFVRHALSVDNHTEGWYTRSAQKHSNCAKLCAHAVKYLVSFSWSPP